MPDPRFAKQVIYVCAHNQEGTMGLAINMPNPAFTVGEVLSSANLPVPSKKMPPVYIGGPVDLEAAFILFSSDYKSSLRLEISETVALSRESQVLEDIARGNGPEKYLFLLGYAGWGPGQLENELLDEGWLTVPGDDSIIFDVEDDKKWKQAALLCGVDITTYGDIVGNA